MSRLLEAAGDAHFTFVVGKGGVGKTTTAGALALELADAGTDTLLISTDPAHSLRDLFTDGSCSARLTVEELDARGAADAWIGEFLPSVSELVQHGTYLDAEDVAGFSRLALPGIDEMMAVKRLAELAADGRRIVVDTAPTGHTLRMLDAAATHESIAAALRAIADKAAAVAGALTGRAVRFSGERVIDRLLGIVDDFRERVLGESAFVIVTRSGSVVAAETERLAAELVERRLRAAAVVGTGGPPATHVEGAVPLAVPRLGASSGCDMLREWRRLVSDARDAPAGREYVGVRQSTRSGPGPEWTRIVLFAGKGGTGKSTCAAALAVTLAAERDVLLCSTDPAGSLGDVLPDADACPRLRVLQIDPAASMSRVRDAYYAEIDAALERLGLAASAELDRRVIESLWNLAPPGIDEMAATAALLDAAESDETVIIDSAPTGHFLRLLEMPDVALDWTRQLMRIVIKYHLAGVAEGAAQALMDLSRELKTLRATLRDASTSSVAIVTLDEPMVHAESARLRGAVEKAGVRIAAMLVNRAHTEAHSGDGAGRVIMAPELEVPPVGVDALRGFVRTWNIVA